MSTMKAYRIVKWDAPGEYQEVPVPKYGSHDVLVRVKAVGLCQSDLHMMRSKPGSDPFATALTLPYTLGHEIAGVVEAVGADVDAGDGGDDDVVVGTTVVLHHMRHCDACDFCQRGLPNLCQRHTRGAIPVTRGCGTDGGLAEYVVVPRTEVIAVGRGADPVLYAPLTDAGVTAYASCMHFIPKLRPGQFAVVVGIGGLGAYGVQFIKRMTAARVIAVDNAPERLASAKALGADFVVPSDANAAAAIKTLTRGRGADALVDFVGINATLRLAADVVRPMGVISVPGMGGGTVELGWSHMQTTAQFMLSVGSTLSDLVEVCALAQEGQLQIDVEKFTWDQIPEAYEKLSKGQLKGRAVIVL